MSRATPWEKHGLRFLYVSTLLMLPGYARLFIRMPIRMPSQNPNYSHHYGLWVRSHRPRYLSLPIDITHLRINGIQAQVTSAAPQDMACRPGIGTVIAEYVNHPRSLSLRLDD